MRLKKLTGFSTGIVALLLVRRPLSRKQRLRMYRQRALRGYALAANDPDFQRDNDEIAQAFDCTVADGLEDVAAR